MTFRPSLGGQVVARFVRLGWLATLFRGSLCYHESRLIGTDGSAFCADCGAPMAHWLYQWATATT